MMNPIYRLAFTGALLAAPAIGFAQTSTAAPDATSPTNSSQPMPNSAQAPAAPAAQTPSENPAPADDQAAAPEAKPKMAQHDEMRHAKRDAAAERETAALNTLSAEGYDDVKDVKTKGDTVDATVSKDGKTMMVEVDSNGTIKPLT